MKNILYIGGFELPDKNAAAHRVINNAKAIRKLGFNVIFLGVDKNLKGSISSECTQNFGFDCWSRAYSNNRLYSIKDIKSVIRKVNCNISYIIAYNYPSIPLLKLIKYCKKNDIVLLSDCTEWYDTKGLKGINKLIKGMDTFFRMRVLHKHVDGMIVISQYLFDYYSNQLKTIKIPPLVDKSLIDLSEEKNLKKNNVIHLTYSGSPGKNKDKLDITIKCLSNNFQNNFLFTIIGVDKLEYLKMYPSLKDDIEKLGNKIVFKGRISHDESLEEIRKSDFLMFYRDINRVSKAGFPTKFSESLSCGIPVITSKTSDLDDYLINGVNGFWLSESKDEINEQIKDILKMDYSSIKFMRDYCRSHAKIFDYNLYLKDFKELFSEE